MDENINILLAACGLYCGACYHYRASFYDDDRLREKGTGAWLATQAERWRCACGESFSWYEEIRQICIHRNKVVK